jgi:hypothetical protein
MNNAIYKSMWEAIEKMNLQEVQQEIARLEASMNDPFPDDDMAGDIALSNLHSHAQQRLRELKP